MQKLLLLLVLVGVSQGAPPDCIATYRFTNRTTDVPDATNVIALTAGTGTSKAINNRSQGCDGWEMMTSVEGLSAISIRLEDSANTYTVTGGSPTQWIAFEGTVVIGTNPSTALTSSTYLATGYYPWIRVNVASSAGTGSVDVILYGWKATSAVSVSGGASGTVTTLTGDGHFTITNPTTTPNIVFNPVTGDYNFFDIGGTIGISQLDPTVAVWKTSVGAPVSSCTAGLHLDLDTTNFDVWFCSATNTWRKLLSTSNSGVFALTGLHGADNCGTVGANNDCLSFDTTDNITVKQNGGTINTYKPAQFLMAGSFSGSAVANAQVAYGIALHTGTINGCHIETDATALTFKLWLITSATAVPTVANNRNTSGISLNSGTAFDCSSLSDFTSLTVTANDKFGIVLSGITGSPTFANIVVGYK